MVWGGIDTWKEEMYERTGTLFRSKGFAVLLLDMPGVGESPLLAGADAERQWTPVFDWLDAQGDLDAVTLRSRRRLLRRLLGDEARLHAPRPADLLRQLGRRRPHHVHARVAGALAGRDSYLMDLMPARARIFGGETFEDYVARCAELSLLDQGLLDTPSAPLLLVNGRDDVQNSIDDIYLSLDHGDPKSARVFDGGHMGEGPVVPTIVDWVEPAPAS